MEIYHTNINGKNTKEDSVMKISREEQKVEHHL